MSAPERIWMTGEDHGASWSGSFRAFRCSSLDHSNDDGPNPDYPEYIRKDASDAAIAAARAEGVRVAASLAAAISLLERGGKAAKKAAPSDKMFDQMLIDYRAALDAFRKTYAEAQP